MSFLNDLKYGGREIEVTGLRLKGGSNYDLPSEHAREMPGRVKSIVYCSEDDGFLVSHFFSDRYTFVPMSAVEAIKFKRGEE